MNDSSSEIFFRIGPWMIVLNASVGIEKKMNLISWFN